MYAKVNPERACTTLLKELTGGEYSKSASRTACPFNCANCKQSNCLGKHVDIIQRMRDYLHQLHSNYIFPYELFDKSETNNEPRETVQKTNRFS